MAMRQACEAAAKEWLEFNNEPSSMAQTLVGFIEKHVSPVVLAAEAAAIEACDAKCQEILESRDPNDVKGIAAANLCGMEIEALLTPARKSALEARMLEARIEGAESVARFHSCPCDAETDLHDLCDVHALIVGWKCELASLQEENGNG